MKKRRSPPRKSAVSALAGHDPLSMRGLMAGYLEWMGVRGYSERSVETRAEILGSFATWCEERGIGRPNEVTRPILQRYQRWMFYYRKKNGQPLGLTTQYERLVVVTLFFRWLTKNNHLLYNPASELELPRTEKRLPRAILSADEAEKVLAGADLATPLGLRDRAILEVLYSTGIRRSELVALTIYSLDQERGTVLIRQGKGKKDRMIPIGERALRWVAKYLAEARPQLVVEPDEGVLFLTGEGESVTPGHLSDLVAGYIDAARIGKKGSCHVFRHTMATLMLEGGADTRFIQQMLGHENLASTQLYTRVSIRKLKEIHTATHPAAKLERRPGRGGGDEGDDTVDATEIHAELEAEAEEDGDGA